MTNKLNLKIITPEKTLLEEQVDAVYSTSTDGKFGILPGHIPYMTPLDIGVTQYVKENRKEFVSTLGGILQVHENTVTILADRAELGSAIDLLRAKAAKERAEERLKASKEGEVDLDRAKLSLARSIARISAASGNL